MTELTTELAERIAFHVLAGDHRKVAARVEGVRHADYLRWEKKGDGDLNEGVDSPEARMLSAVEASEAICEKRWVAQIVTASEGSSAQSRNWTAKMTLLERRFPDRWSRKLPGFAEGKTESPDEFFAKLAAEKAKAEKK